MNYNNNNYNMNNNNDVITVSERERKAAKYDEVIRRYYGSIWSYNKSNNKIIN